jgi:GNAT superfamily N-acetyltransferase
MTPVRELSAASHGEITDVLCDAFAEYPVMRFVLGERYRERRRLFRLIGFFVTARVLREDLLLGVDGAGGLAAVALVTLPRDRSPPPALDREREAVWAELGPAARTRYEAFSRACAPFALDARHMHLNMIGARRAAQGQGLGRLLLEQVHELSRASADSQGVSLTTEDPRNVPLYRHFGYRVTGHAQVAPELESWGFFRSD